MKTCHHCSHEVLAQERIGRRDTCPQCGSDLRCCLNCLFHDPRLANACQEPNAERQLDKEIGNFCEYFAFVEARRAPSASATAASQARAQLDALFRKKPS